MNALARIDNGPRFRALDAAGSAMILGGQETVNTFVRNGDGSLAYVGSDLVLEPAKPRQAAPADPVA